MQSQFFHCFEMVCNTFGNLDKFVRNSPKRLRIFEHLQDARCQIFKAFCSTTGVLRDCSLTSVLANYAAVEFIKEIADSDKSEADRKAGGFCQQLNRFETFYAV